VPKTGAKVTGISIVLYTIPLRETHFDVVEMYIPNGDRLLVIASNIGAPAHPDRYRNLVAHPEVTVEVGSYSAPTRALTLAMLNIMPKNAAPRWRTCTN